MKHQGRGRNLFKRNDVKRAVRSIREADVPLRGIRFDPGGGFELIIGEPANENQKAGDGNDDGNGNEWDRDLGKNQTQAR